MSDPARTLDALLAEAPRRSLPRLSLVDAERQLIRLTQPDSAPPMSIPPPPASIASGPEAQEGPWSAPPIELTPEARAAKHPEQWAAADPETAAPPTPLPEAASAAPPRMGPPPLKASRAEPPRLIIISEPPADSMFSLADLEDEDERGAGASISEIISPITPPPLPSDSISEAIVEAAQMVRGGRDDVIDLDASSIELVFIEDNPASSTKS